MKQRMLVVLLAVGCIVAGGIAVFLQVSQDGEAPVITVEDRDITYTEGEDYEGLMEGVTAEDNRDGDVTDQVFVDRMIPVSADQAIVYYGAVDSSNNVGTASRKITYIAASGDTQEEGEPEEGSSEGSAEAPAEGTGASPETAQPDEGVLAQALVPNGASPTIVLNTDQMTIAAGTPFDVLSVVYGVVDDVDSVDVLSTHISAEGEYNTSVPGSYELRYYVVDSSGNASEPKIFTLTVQ